jgi:hypothetical protein
LVQPAPCAVCSARLAKSRGGCGPDLGVFRPAASTERRASAASGLASLPLGSTTEFIRSGLASDRSCDRLLGISHGVLLPSTTSARAIVTWRFTSPSPSALSVSHALSGLIPPGPRGLVSCRSRPWDYGLQRVSRQLSRAASQRPLPPCRWFRERCRGSPTSRPCSERASVSSRRLLHRPRGPIRS